MNDNKESEWIDIDYSIFGSVHARCKRCTRIKTVKGKDTGFGYEYKLPMYCENCGAEMKNGGVLK